MWVEEKCNNTCRFYLIDVPCSEMCDAGVGDYCQAADAYIEDDEEEE